MEFTGADFIRAFALLGAGLAMGFGAIGPESVKVTLPAALAKPSVAIPAKRAS